VQALRVPGQAALVVVVVVVDRVEDRVALAAAQDAARVRSAWQQLSEPTFPS